MAQYPCKGESVWEGTVEKVVHPALKADMRVDVAIIGAGIAGLQTAYELKKRGVNVAVFEKPRVGEGISGYTTAKITSQHGQIYSELIKKFDHDTARIYGQANQAALKRIGEIVKNETIDCDWQEKDNYVYTFDRKQLDSLKIEAADAQSLGLPASFTNDVPLPFSVEGAVRFERQATFHVGKYLQHLAKLVNGGGSYVFETSKATNVNDGELCSFRVNGHTVTCDNLVLATNIPAPLRDHAAYSLLAYPTRSYLVAGKIDRDIEGMYINVDTPTRSILQTTLNGERWLLIGGEGRFVGLGGPARKSYGKLVAFAREKFNIKDIPCRWSAWDYVAYDELPLIGKMYPFSKHVYVATGFRKWGMTNGVVAALILADTLTGKKNEWAYTFRSTRASTVANLPRGMLKGIFK